ncbi:MAG: biotin/lipoyl-containing protein, partial [Candidatus Hydrogenedentota bacterium]
MAIDLVIPAVGESISEVEIGTWLKQLGEAVAKDEAVCEIESDKATVEVYAPVDGVLGEILMQTGEVAAVGDIVGTMDEGGTGTAAAPAATESKPEPAPETAAKEPLVMPAAKRAIAEAGATAEKIEGTGKGGRILKEDVEKTSTPAPSVASTLAPTPQASSGGPREEEAVRMTPIRRKIAKHLLNAQQNAALLTTFKEVDMSGVMDMRSQFKDA